MLLSKKPRVVVRKSCRYIKGQFVEYNQKGDKVLVFVESKELKKFGWKGIFNNIPAAYLTGILFAKKIGKKKAILDLGMQISIKGNVLYGFVKGCIDGGLNIPCSKNMFPSEDRLNAKHIADYAKLLKDDKSKFEKQFGKTFKDLDSEKFIDHIKEVKQKILEK